MAKKKAASLVADASAAVNGSASSTNGNKPKAADPSTSSLTISRNKHWRYISAFHGPWLQLPHEILETLAHSNYLSPRPRQADPGVLFDLLKVRKLVDEAADLTVRAQNGTASSALSGDNGLPGAALGLNTRGGANAKLSPERKYRMRELAIQKLSEAYRLDEIAASVATMQSASTLDSVASLVLQRTPHSTDANYVHFFHEKIPSRMMAEYTPLDPLNDIIAREPGHAAPLRTRALTKIFKDDHHGAAQDLTEALALCRMEQAKHSEGKNQLISMKQARDDAERRRVWSRDWMQEHRVAEDDQPRGMEMQLLFQRGTQFLTLACQNIKTALECFSKLQKMRNDPASAQDIFLNPSEALKLMTSAEQELFRRGLEARETVRKHAKRALRDFTAYFAQLDYAFAEAGEAPSEVFDRSRFTEEGALGTEHGFIEDGPAASQALTRRSGQSSQESSGEKHDKRPHEPLLKVHAISEMLSASPPGGLPDFPPMLGSQLALRNGPQPQSREPLYQEMITYHPLMPESFHALLLSHTLLQTPPTTISRIATNVARLVRLADGYPFFLSARSPSRADWSEILRKTHNWVDLAGPWDKLCKAGTQLDAAPTPSSSAVAKSAPMPKGAPADGGEGVKASKVTKETEEDRKERIRQEAVIDALGDERVVDDESFAKAVAAREKRALRDLDGPIDVEAHPGATTPSSTSDPRTPSSEVATPTSADGADGDWSLMKHLIRARENGEPYGRNVPNKAPVAKDEEYMIGTERAEAIARWVIEAPANVGHLDGTRPKRKKRPARKRMDEGVGLENSVGSLSVGSLSVGPD